MADQEQPYEHVRDLLRVVEELNHLKDLNSILDRILIEARRIASAEAGTIFLIDGDKLRFSYIQNVKLFTLHNDYQYIYADQELPIDENSIVGYAALSGKTIVLDDVYHLPKDVPFSFNASFDEKTGYKTTSILTIPLKTLHDKLVGIIQIINPSDSEGTPVPFSESSQLFISLFANNAAAAIEHGLMTRRLILRMMKMAEMRDPKETGAHIQRVGSYTAEIYHKWAVDHGVDHNELMIMKDQIRLASMLHDIGKIGIPDSILKKPGALIEEEYNIMKAHTIHGYRLFADSDYELDVMSGQIALNHHEKWDGTGYPGKVLDILSDDIQFGEGKKGEEIPLEARITSLADIFDALCSERSYKSEWPDVEVLEYLKNESGKHFDPEVLDAFISIFDVIKAIRDRFV